MYRTPRTILLLGVCGAALLAPHSRSAAAQDADSARVERRHCRPLVAFGMGLVIPGGGQFYLGDVSGGIQAVASDVILFEALHQSGSTATGIAFFLGAVHVVEGLFAAQACRTKRGARASPPLPPPPAAAYTGFGGADRSLRRSPWRERWRAQITISLTLSREGTKDGGTLTIR